MINWQLNWYMREMWNNVWSSIYGGGLRSHCERHTPIDILELWRPKTSVIRNTDSIRKFATWLALWPSVSECGMKLHNASDLQWTCNITVIGEKELPTENLKSSHVEGLQSLSYTLKSKSPYCVRNWPFLYCNAFKSFLVAQRTLLERLHIVL